MMVKKSSPKNLKVSSTLWSAILLAKNGSGHKANISSCHKRVVKVSFEMPVEFTWGVWSLLPRSSFQFSTTADFSLVEKWS